MSFEEHSNSLVLETILSLGLYFIYFLVLFINKFVY